MHNIYADTFMIAARFRPEPICAPELRPCRGQKPRRRWRLFGGVRQNGGRPDSGQTAAVSDKQ